MTQRKHSDSSVVCAGCGREFGIIQAAHITRCPGLAQLGVTTRAEYCVRFGSTWSATALASSVKTIVSYNESKTAEARAEHAKVGHAAALAKHPDLYKKGGLKGSASLWNKPGQKDRHTRRLIDLNSKGFMVQKPNKLEQKFWDLVGADRIDFASFVFWKKIATERGYSHITPDFRVRGTTAVIEVYGDYWHAGEDPGVRIQLWASVGC
jgi:hypothetical protein